MSILDTTPEDYDAINARFVNALYEIMRKSISTELCSTHAKEVGVEVPEENGTHTT